MKTLIWNTLSPKQQHAALSRPSAVNSVDVSRILDDVRNNGDAALLSYTQKFDGVALAHIKVPKAGLKPAWDGLPNEDKAAMKIAKANIEAFHSVQMPQTLICETMPGVVCRREPRPLDSVGLYVPGGTAPLVSTLMMLAIPAKLAEVPQITIVTPPQKNGDIAAPLKAAAYLCGVKNIYKVGGAQAIAALAYGTQTIPKAVKILGPGNIYVASAKAHVSTQLGGPAIDLPAGPSEVMVMADDQANPIFVAADLLAQAEHDTLAQVICVCTSKRFSAALQIEMAKQLRTLPRKKIATSSLKNGHILITNTLKSMTTIVNYYAPEHLIVHTKNPNDVMPFINNAGSVFLGPWTPESVGDYASGTNHTLPTFGAARAYSGVTLESFMKFISVQTLSRAGLENLGPAVKRLAQMEGLEAHKRAVSVRLSNEHFQ